MILGTFLIYRLYQMPFLIAHLQPMALLVAGGAGGHACFVFRKPVFISLPCDRLKPFYVLRCATDILCFVVQRAKLYTQKLV